MNTHFAVRSIAVAATVALSSCAGVTFYTDPGLTQQTGIPIYAPKPYLLVSRTGAKDKPVDISVVYLNDQSKVVYAKPRSGFGSANLTLALANGQMTSFGQQTDTKIPELITALSGMVTARAGAEKTGAEAQKILSDLNQGATTVAIGKKVETIETDIGKALTDGRLSGLTGTEVGPVKAAQKALEEAAKVLIDPLSDSAADAAALATVKAQAEVLGKLGETTGGDSRASSVGLVKTWAAELKSIFDQAQPEKPAQPTFELYEILQSAAGTKLVRVAP